LNSKWFALMAAGLFLSPIAQADSPPPNLPETFPTCPSPQPIAPRQPAGGLFVATRAAVAWNGRDYAVVYTDGWDSTLHFQRFFADGTPSGPNVTLAIGLLALQNYAPSLAWNGTGYGVVFVALTAAKSQVYFISLDGSGSKLTGPTVIDGFPTFDNIDPVIAWSGSGYAVAWTLKLSATDFDIYASLLNPAGTVTLIDVAITTPLQQQEAPAIAWSQGAVAYEIVWQDKRTGTHYEIYGRQIYLNTGGLSPEVNLISAGATDSLAPSLADTGDGLGLACEDARNANYEIYFARLTPGGGKIGTELRLTSDVSISSNSQVVWTGAEYGIFWNDLRSGNFDLWFQRVSATGTAISGNIQLTATGGATNPVAAFGRSGFLLTGRGGASVNFELPIGCGADNTPPSCPGNFNAYNITGTSASVTWSPAGDGESDFAYYQVYRNNALIGKTSNEYYNDSGLPLSTTNNYMIQPVNAWQLQNYGCTGSIYVKTNSSLTLTLNKSNPDAVLNWTDAGFNSYNIFRGTDPRVMSQIGATPALTGSDVNALNGSLSYFYSVDNPGP
jgi:hypothetical protein